MHRTGALALLSAVAISAAATSSQAATYLTVGPNSLCGSEGCFAGKSRTYTQTFSAAERAGVVDVGSFALARDVVGSMSNFAVKVTFQLADGTEVTWGKYTVAALGGDKFVTIGGEKLDWDTALGDLKVRLDLIIPEKGGAGGGGFFGGGAGMGGGGGGGSIAGDLPLGDIVTSGPLIRPSLPPQPVIAVPEPSAWALMIVGFGAAGTLLRRRRAYHPWYG